ncbi:hypothetical protein MHH33_16015 [Paenisporosarcina sp. FSL H8-0542]|uniref:hypothetical protein n=1 Tax=unclassified Paenisporosarcina TaxID=2642018 RepID=UPI00034E45C7|nr:hypothetical protein [Paenisporosarcina sp. HGH0030]EPD51414.1 hypothetical protein HMPREF1210_02012 [Paenisporosarcina sp. HGH0030]
MENLIGLIAVVMVFSIPLTAIILGHLRGNQKLRAKMLKDELELEKLKGENFIAETEKMRLELEKLKLDFTKTEDPVLLELQKEKVTII